MSWPQKPKTNDVVSWFSTVELDHPELRHADYVGGIVAIENKLTKQWNPFVLAATRIAYFWDWINLNDLTGHIFTSDPQMFAMPFMGGVEPGSFVTAQSLFISATVQVKNGRDILRESTGRKQVSLNVKINRGNTTIPAYDAVMKAETGAIARGIAQLGIMALPGSGIASAEDMFDYIREQETPSTTSDAEPIGRKAVNPKANAKS